MRSILRLPAAPAAFAAALLACLACGPAAADTAGPSAAATEVARIMRNEHVVLRSASGARIAELTDIRRPRAREDEVTVASRGTDPEALDTIFARALATPKLDVATLDAMPPARGDADWQCLAQAIYFESRGEPLDGQVAVAEVVLNRVDSRSYPRTVCGVTHQGCQFSYVCDGRSDTMNSALPRQRAEKIASLMLAGRKRTITDGATHFHTRAVRPDWSRRFTRTAYIGHHLFYRAPTRVAGG
jgi:spore germination cell wall hydrolase CwlJ-like protein